VREDRFELALTFDECFAVVKLLDTFRAVDIDESKLVAALSGLTGLVSHEVFASREPAGGV
jgi:hypothetical protein